MARRSVGKVWRIGTSDGTSRGPQFSVRSYAYGDGQGGPGTVDATFDELVIANERSGRTTRECIHVEMMDSRTYFVGLGKIKQMVRFKTDGTIEVGERYE